MGLDMYLTRETWISPNRKNDAVDVSIFPWIKANQVFTITERVIYWRKANHVHAWFVNNIQHGEDNCQKSTVDMGDLIQLRDTCLTVMNDKSRAEELLPPQAGFFFGSTDIDEYYFGDVQMTLDSLNKIIEEHDTFLSTRAEVARQIDEDFFRPSYVQYAYQASW